MSILYMTDSIDRRPTDGSVFFCIREIDNADGSVSLGSEAVCMALSLPEAESLLKDVQAEWPECSWAIFEEKAVHVSLHHDITP